MDSKEASSKELYLSRAVHHYGSLFTLPRYWLLVLFLLIVSLVGSIVAFTIIAPSSDGLLRGALFGLEILFLPSITLDAILRALVTRPYGILDLRRITALSLITCVAYVALMVGGAVLQALLWLSSALLRATLLGVCVVLGLRLLILSTVISLPLLKLVTAVVTPPIFLLVLNIVFWQSWSLQLITVVMASSAILVIATQYFVHTINRQGKLVLGIGSISLFQGFLANWLENATSPLEDYFEKLGTSCSVSVNIFKFSGEKGSKAVLSIPDIHPGPFRNLGSSDLPGKMQHQLETRFSAPAAVPHGISGHELDLTSQLQLNRVLSAVQDAKIADSFSSVSSLVRVDTGLAKATCQIFGKVALVTVTCAPTSMEDIPLSIGKRIEEAGRRLGLKHVAIIDAHNSISASKEMGFLSKDEVQALASTADTALAAATQEGQKPLQMGVAKIVPDEFTVGQGMGPGGIIVLAVIAGRQKALYITVDGNNMISGLREKIIQALSDISDECEVLTTDTHVVNAVGTMGRGYYAVGEALNQERLIFLIRETAVKALGNVEGVEVSFARIRVDGVNVLGDEKITSLTMLVDQTFSLMKWMAPLTYVPALSAMIALFAFAK